MNHFLCSFEVNSGSAEWNRLGCSRWYNATASSSTTSAIPANVDPLASSGISVNSTVTVGGGNWRKVRHTPSGSTWGPFADHLNGTETSGNSNDDSQAWTV